METFAGAGSETGKGLPRTAPELGGTGAGVAATGGAFAGVAFVALPVCAGGGAGVGVGMGVGVGATTGAAVGLGVAGGLTAGVWLNAVAENTANSAVNETNFNMEPPTSIIQTRRVRPF